MRPHGLGLLVGLAFLVACGERAPTPSALARDVASYAVETYGDSVERRLGELIAFRTVAQDGIPNAEHPEFRALTAYLAQLAADLGLDFVDHGAVIIIGLGDADERLGVLAHADVQPADPAKWMEDPFQLDAHSEHGRLIGRGVEDDKGPIAAALYAMRAVRDRGVPLERRIELVITYTEESDWGPIREFVAQWDPPGINVALDSEYPVVIAEKAWNGVFLKIPPDRAAGPGPRLATFTGGEFLSQIPEDAEATIMGPSLELEHALREAAASDSLAQFTFERVGETLNVAARGLAAHSSKPWQGRNAITHLAALLGVHDWPSTQAGRMVRMVNDLVGTGDYGERFGKVAYEHDFMGPLTLSLTMLGPGDADTLVAGINIRSPVGMSGEALERAIDEAVESWKRETGIDAGISTLIGEPYYIDDAPQVPVLLDIFRFYSGMEDAQPIAIGGGTNARLLPFGVNFGPAMPGEPYTGHSEHEFMTRAQLLLNLEMYTAMLVELAGAS